MPTLILALVLVFAACERKAAPRESGRVNAVAATPHQESLEAFCDARPAAATFVAPPLAEGSAPISTQGWRWVNIWATWCKPCLEELPRLAKWQRELTGEGTPFELVLLSADAAKDTMTQFQAAHPETQGSLQLADPKALAGWLPSLGLDIAAPIPIHVLVGPDNRVRCARSGAVSDDHLEAVRGILKH